MNTWLSAHHIAVSPLLGGSILERQIEIEAGSVRDGAVRYRRMAREAVQRGEGASLKPAERLMLHWFEPLTRCIRLDQRAIRRGEPEVGRAIHGPILLLLRPAELATITMHETISRCMQQPSGVPAKPLAHALGRAVIAEATMRDLRSSEDRDERSAHEHLATWCRNLNPSRVNWYVRKNIKTIDDARFSRTIYVQTGTRLLWHLIGCASVSTYGPDFRLAFHYGRVPRRGKTIATLRMDDEAMRLIEEGHEARQHLRPRYEPMLVAPLPWRAESRGGYVRLPVPMMSKATARQKERLAASDLSQVHDCLNALNATAWEIDPWMHEIMRREYDRGGGEIGIPRAEPHPTPPMPADVRDDESKRSDWKRARRSTHVENIRLASARVEFLAKLDVASRFEGQRFYQPHQLDFRGRAYPIAPHLHHQGDDVCRALLRFADPKPVGAHARRWLYIHAANCFEQLPDGTRLDKLPYDERLAWAVAQEDRMRLIALDPSRDAMWRQAEKPWQFLAACRAIALDAAAARLPVQVDGTCNGLQHYAALGRDADAAATVNMVAAHHPSDVYTQVASVVAGRIADELQSNPLAAGVLPYVNRATVKNTVMTHVYGVTMIGARLQTAAALRKAGHPGDRDTIYAASIYLSQHTLRGIGVVCSAAANIMDWLRRLASAIAVGHGRPIEWTSPLGLPVCQPYRRWRKARVCTLLGSLTLITEDERVPIMAARHVSAFAPNFVHAIDASHMLLSARACRDEQIDFAAVHDSYWTHAATMDRMNRILREQFIALHSRPLLQELAAELRRAHPETLFPDPPSPGRYAVADVLGAEYFFS